MGTREILPKALFLPALFAFVLFIGCIPLLDRLKPASPPPVDPVAARDVDESAEEAEKDEKEENKKKKPGDLVHTVQWRGESLSIIAKWYTGDVRNWKALAEHNPLNDPDRIRIGDRVSIPETLLRTREPIPKAFVDNLLQRPGQSGPAEDIEPAQPGPDEEDLLELFGPKDLK